MESSTILPRKYFVVVTENSALQFELEKLLSSRLYNALSTSQAKIFIESAAQHTYKTKLCEPPSHIEKILPSYIKGGCRS